ncbi:4510_t:CDS:2, partial [Entrophospora sp. SA101]
SRKKNTNPKSILAEISGNTFLIFDYLDKFEHDFDEKMYVYEPGDGFYGNGARVVSKYCFDHYGDRYKQFFIRCGDYFHELLQHGTEFFVEMEPTTQSLNYHDNDGLSDEEFCQQRWESSINRLTLACGTGSTSCVALAKRLKLIDQDASKVTVNVPGGYLIISNENGRIYLGGP